MDTDMLVRVLLLPFSLLYGLGVSVRELFYRFGIIKSLKFSVPVIGIGNLSVGGTGKTPHVEYLLRWLDTYLNVTTMSRGYGRTSVGLREVHALDKIELVGDEALQIKRKHRNIPVFVAENRSLGIPGMIQMYPNTQAIVLDDAFQHRAVLPGRQILLTEYARPYTRDWLLPAGRLREWRSGARRADIIIVTKCPIDLSEAQKADMKAEIQPNLSQSVYFSTYVMQRPYHLWQAGRWLILSSNVNALMVSAIASTDYLLEQLSAKVGTLRNLSFRDHHLFELDDFATIAQDFGYMNTQDGQKVVLCTEKDAVKLERFVPQFAQAGIDVFVVATQVQFLGEDEARFKANLQTWMSEFRV
jgi:tetraacyldisaccharide 4'-kinase